MKINKILIKLQIEYKHIREFHRSKQCINGML